MKAGCAFEHLVHQSAQLVNQGRFGTMGFPFSNQLPQAGYGLNSWFEKGVLSYRFDDSNAKACGLEGLQQSA